MPTGKQDVSVLITSSADPCPPANLRTMPPRDVGAHLELVALSRSDAVEDGAHTCRERASIFGKWSKPVSRAQLLLRIRNNEEKRDRVAAAVPILLMEIERIE